MQNITATDSSAVSTPVAENATDTVAESIPTRDPLALASQGEDLTAAELAHLAATDPDMLGRVIAARVKFASEAAGKVRAAASAANRSGPKRGTLITLKDGSLHTVGSGNNIRAAFSAAAHLAEKRATIAAGEEFSAMIALTFSDGAVVLYDVTDKGEGMKGLGGYTALLVRRCDNGEELKIKSNMRDVVSAVVIGGASDPDAVVSVLQARKLQRSKARKASANVPA
jgi:hypothetical protein